MGKSGGGGGGPSQTTSTSNVSNIPEYARPYVETMLGATQKQLFNTTPTLDESGNPTGGQDITGFQPYKAYGATYDENGKQTSYDPSKAIAGFSPLQQQAQQGIANMQLPGTYGAGAGMTGVAGMNAMNAGQNLQNTLTNPGAMGQYMNPYIQNALQPQLEEMQRQYGITGTNQMSNATKAGAFGGNREALMASENERNKNMAMNQVIGQGYNQAFQNAQQQAGNVANLGLQGYQAAGQAGSALANIGGQALQAQQGIYGAQNQMGAQQQAQQQQIINQSIQDYANAQQYPLMQLGVMSNMLRGLPMQSSTTNQYVAAPNQITQGIGLAGAGASILNATKKEGGVIKEMASGGITGYNVGGSIRSKLYDMEANDIQQYIKESSSPAAKEIAEEVLRDKTGKAGGGIIAFRDSTNENNQSLVRDVPEVDKGKSLLAGYEQEVADKAKAKFNFGEPKKAAPAKVEAAPEAPVEKANPEMVRKAYLDAANMQKEKNAALEKFAKDPANTLSPNESIVDPRSIKAAAPPPVAPAPAPANKGPGMPELNPDGSVKLPPEPNAAPTAKPAAVPTVNKGVGLVPNQGLAPDIGGIKLPTRPVEETQEQLNKGAEERIKAYGINEGNQKAMAAAQAEKANAKDEARRITSLRMAEFFGAWGSTPGNTIVAGLNALKNKMPDFVTDMKEESKIRRQIDKDIAELDKLDREEKNGIKKDYFAERAKLSERAMHTYGYELTAYTHALQTKAYEKVGIAGANARGGGGEDRALTNLIGRQTEIEKAITAKVDKLDPMTKTYSAMGDSNNPKTQERIVAARAKVATETKDLQAQKTQVKNLIDTYRKVQGLSDNTNDTSVVPTGNRPPLTDFQTKK